VRHCVDKFASVNQRLMGTYIEVQSSINEKRMADYEQQMKEAELAAQAAAVVPVAPVESAEPIGSISS